MRNALESRSTSFASIWSRTTGHVRVEIITLAERAIKSSLLRRRCPLTRRAVRVYLFGNDRTRCEFSPKGAGFVKRRVERRVVMLFDRGANKKVEKNSK